jgi:hypothetical protein
MWVSGTVVKEMFGGVKCRLGSSGLGQCESAESHEYGKCSKVGFR